MTTPSSELRVTERRNPRSADVDLASPLAIVDLMNAEDATVPAAVASQREAIALAVSAAEAAFRLGEGHGRKVGD